MRSSSLSGAAAVLAVAQLCSAQTFTSCNPTTNSSCPSDPALGKTITVDFTKGKSDYFTLAEGTSLTYDETNGASFVMSQEGQAPTITSTDYIFFGKVSIAMKAAKGTGIVSSFVMESDDLDEIDWEWVGGDTTQAESNYFGKGNTTTYNRAIWHSMAAAPQDDFHIYTVEWSKESVIWSIDGTSVRTLLYADAVGGANFPQTPMVIKVGNWDGGASTESEGTIEWAGGLTDWSQAPFTMYVKNITIEDSQTGATSYTYGDMTGSYESIDISTSGTSSSLSASASATASGSASSASASGSTSSSSSSSSSSGSNSSSSGSASSSAPTTPPFLNPASNVTSSSNLTTSGTPTGSSSTTKSSSDSSSSSASASSSSTLTNSSDANSRYGTIDIAVVVLGLTMGYLFM